MYVNDFVTYGKTLIFQQLTLYDDFVEEIWNLSLQSYSNKNFLSSLLSFCSWHFSVLLIFDSQKIKILFKEKGSIAMKSCVRIIYENGEKDLGSWNLKPFKVEL